MYDYYLGGKDNFACDREAAERVIEAFPGTRVLAQANRAFLQRAVRYLAHQQVGVRQFLDLGSGLPTKENVHEVAQQINPEARVAYVDWEPTVLAHGRALLATDEQTIMVEGDLRKPEKILADPGVRGHFDFNAPIAVLLVFVLHFIRETENPYGIVQTLIDAMVPNSHLVISHAVSDPRLVAGVEVYRKANAPAVLRSPEQITTFFDGVELIEPGVVRLDAWRPDGPLLPEDRDLPALGGVGRK
jgi:hypothetical protein